MKRLVMLLLVLSLSVGILGCASSSDTDRQTTTETETTTEAVSQTITEEQTEVITTIPDTTTATSRETHNCYTCGCVTDGELFCGHYICWGCRAQFDKLTSMEIGNLPEGKDVNQFDYYEDGSYYTEVYCYHCGHRYATEDNANNSHMHTYGVCPVCNYRTMIY